MSEAEQVLRAEAAAQYAWRTRFALYLYYRAAGYAATRP